MMEFDSGLLTFIELRAQEPEEDEEIISCICGIYKDEGLMIQCEKCHVSPMFLNYLLCKAIYANSVNLIFSDQFELLDVKNVPFSKRNNFLQIWQHCDCMGVDGDVENYLCEKCDPRPLSLVSRLIG